jgi:hypothetical protein
MELIVKTDSVAGDSHYKDGDIVQAFSNDRIYMCHAEMICSVKNFPLDVVTGLRPNGGLFMKFMEKSHQFKFVRVSETEVKRINLDTLEEDILSNTPNSSGERIDVHQYLLSRFRISKHTIFGESGAEIWYGKSRRGDIEAIWNDIETHSDNLKNQHSSWPLTDIEKRHFLPLNASGFKGGIVTEISNDTVSDRNLAVYQTKMSNGGEEEVLVAKRQWQVPYWDLAVALDINIDDARNKDKSLDGRKPKEERPHIDDINLDKINAGIIII